MFPTLKRTRAHLFSCAFQGVPPIEIVDFYIDAGLKLNGIIPGRSDDLISIGGAYVHISPNASLVDQEKAFFSGVPTPIRKYEGLFEMTYQAQVMTGWTLQPDFQYIFRPGGGISSPTTRPEFKAFTMRR